MKKILSLLTSFGLGLALLGAGCTNKLEGTWTSVQPIEGIIAEIEFTKSRIIGSGEFVQAFNPSNKSQAKVIVDYRITKQKDNTSFVTIRNPEANIVGSYADEKQQNQWQEDTKKFFETNDDYEVTVAADGKSMTIKTANGQLIPFRRK